MRPTDRLKRTVGGALSPVWIALIGGCFPDHASAQESHRAAFEGLQREIRSLVPESVPKPLSPRIERPWPWNLADRSSSGPKANLWHVTEEEDPLIWLFPDHPKHWRNNDGETLEREDFLNEEEKTTFGAQQGGNRGQPDVIGRLIDPIGPELLHFAFDRWLGLDIRKTSHLPKAPEIPEALYYDLMRPLGALKYDNEINYLIGSFTGSQPTLQLLEMEYMFADWRSVELQLNWDNGVFDAAVPGYQRTLGVGPEGNWVHAYQLQLPLYTHSKIVGARAAYFFAWQPDKESPFSMYLIAGAEHVAVEKGAGNSYFPIYPTSVSSMASTGPRVPPPGAAHSAIGVWRPLAALDLFYTLNERLSVGVENDAFIDDKFGNYIVLPQVQWQPLVHVTFKAGAGWYQFAGESQAIFSARLMITQPTPRKPKDDYDPNPGRLLRGGFRSWSRRGR